MHNVCCVLFFFLFHHDHSLWLQTVFIPVSCLVVLLLTQNRLQRGVLFLEASESAAIYFPPLRSANTLYPCARFDRSRAARQPRKSTVKGLPATCKTLCALSLIYFYRDSLHHRSFHQLCDRCGASRKTQPGILDQTGSRPHLCTRLLNTFCLTYTPQAGFFALYGTIK